MQTAASVLAPDYLSGVQISGVSGDTSVFAMHSAPPKPSMSRGRDGESDQPTMQWGKGSDIKHQAFSREAAVAVALALPPVEASGMRRSGADEGTSIVIPLAGKGS